ncbi:MAG: penicillin-binding protein 2 [Candidatus Sungbacteria bacterium RIFCSPHIGHO2_02_FULL_49_12]|uniref:Penicillin-binding protein 2 n=1 Tax=Candidatus Sungbacteria bacterium RIFCSPHIGHO2_02_FULL_49_12 TaxID=1802271 RepID=A0A1G2KNP3_9BACT|nr:MAG: penicillin-binding protein 2 [Candidatus Sungbacteria bacterium RIFCSPHIGHO2_02_FULL_49_12]
MWLRHRRLFSKRSSPGFEVDPEEILMDAVNPADFDTDRLEGRIEFAISRGPFVAGLAIICLGIFVLFLRSGYLQIVRGSEFRQRAENNRLLSITLPSPRGLVYDINGAPLVKNTPSFEIVLKRDELPDDANLRILLGRALAGLLGKSDAEIAVSGFDPVADKKILPPELVIASDVTRDQAVDVQSRPKDFPGAFLRTRELRLYPSPAFSHVIGYVGRIDASQVRDVDGYSATDLIGKNGIELAYEKELRGTNGEQLIEVNSSGVALGELPKEEPVIGHSLVLNIDARLQEVVYNTLLHQLDAFGKTAGSAVVLDPRNGAVRALVSIPSFDPNILRRHISQSDYQRIFLTSSKPFFNRAISGVYPSGSVIKPMMAVAALEEKVIDPNRKIYDPGFISVPNPYSPGVESIFPDWRPQGWVDMRSALQWSANVYFYIIGGGYRDIKGLGISKIGEWMKKFGFGSLLGIDLPGEVAGLVPGPESIKKTRPKDPVWRLGDTYHASIGQGDFQTTPLQIAAMTAVVANGGTLWRPQVVSKVLDENGNMIQTIAPEVIRTHLADPASFQIAREGMRLVATEGTARAYFADFIVDVAGKTGTAETGFEKNTNGWFTAFAPYSNPEIVVVVVAEDVVANSAIATPVTRDIIQWYFTEGKKQATSSLLTAGD